MAKKLILVTGATGKQGRALIRALNLGDSDSEPDFHVWALTRTVSSPAANELAAHNTQHVTVVQGNLDSPDDLRRIFEDAKKDRGGVWGVFCALAFPGLGANADGEEKQGKVRLLVSTNNPTPAKPLRDPCRYFCGIRGLVVYFLVCRTRRRVFIRYRKT